MTVVTTEKMDKFLANLVSPTEGKQVTILDFLRELDFPTTRNEYWKYTRLGKIANTSFTNEFAQKQELDIADYCVSSNFLIIENGRVRKDLSQLNTDFEISFNTPESVDTASELDENHVFTAFNSSFYEKEISISTPSKVKIEAPLQLIFVNHGENVVANNRIKISAGKFSESTIILTSISDSGTNCFNNTVITAEVEENANLTVHKLQAENNTNLSVSTEQIRQGKNSTFRINTFTFSGLLVRNNINIVIAGEGCSTYMNGAIITKSKEHIDNHTFVDHQVPNCYSNENYKYVLDGQSTGVFNGRVIVRKDAQVINAYQNNGNILLSENASINSKPELEIYADDVKCSHGSTTGQLDENALYYLQTRGISKAKAKKILVAAFVGEIIETVNYEAFKTLLKTVLKREHNWDF